MNIEGIQVIGWPDDPINPSVQVMPKEIHIIVIVTAGIAECFIGLRTRNGSQKSALVTLTVLYKTGSHDAGVFRKNSGSQNSR